MLFGPVKKIVLHEWMNTKIVLTPECVLYIFDQFIDVKHTAHKWQLLW